MVKATPSSPFIVQCREDRGASFKSVHGTLNHLLVADRIWRQRFTGEGEAQVQALAHLFNQKTHHRGRAHNLPTPLTGRAPELDLLFYQRPVAMGKAAPPRAGLRGGRDIPAAFRAATCAATLRTSVDTRTWPQII